MAGVYKRQTDKSRGKAGKWTAWYLGEDGRRHSRAAFTDKAKSVELANHLESEARMVREGLVEPGERARREASLRPAADHVADYCLSLRAKDDTPKHVRDVHQALARLLDDASIATLAELDLPRIEQAVGRLRVARSARTANKVAGYAKAWLSWLVKANRLKEAPRGWDELGGYNESADRRRVRRVLTRPELDALLAAAESGPPFEAFRGPRSGPRSVVWITGPQRAAVYRLAMGTGFRAEEIRTLTPERFALDATPPTVTVLACYAKSGKQAVQPVRPDLAAAVRPHVEGRPPGEAVFPIPVKTAKMLRRDLKEAGIDPGDGRTGVVDFHALRHSYITHLVRSGVNPKTVQALARHSTITLTLDRYTHVEVEDLSSALERAASALGA